MDILWNCTILDVCKINYFCLSSIISCITLYSYSTEANTKKETKKWQNQDTKISLFVF